MLKRCLVILVLLSSVGLAQEAEKADVWEPLLAIGQSINPRWARSARDACLHLVGESRGSHPSLNVALLDDLRTVFTDAGQPEAIPSATLVEVKVIEDESAGVPTALGFSSRGDIEESCHHVRDRGSAPAEGASRVGERLTLP